MESENVHQTSFNINDKLKDLPHPIEGITVRELVDAVINTNPATHRFVNVQVIRDALESFNDKMFSDEQVAAMSKIPGAMGSDARRLSRVRAALSELGH